MGYRRDIIPGTFLDSFCFPYCRFCCKEITNGRLARLRHVFFGAGPKVQRHVRTKEWLQTYGRRGVVYPLVYKCRLILFQYNIWTVAFSMTIQQDRMQHSTLIDNNHFLLPQQVWFVGVGGGCRHCRTLIFPLTLKIRST